MAEDIEDLALLEHVTLLECELLKRKVKLSSESHAVINVRIRDHTLRYASILKHRGVAQATNTKSLFSPLEGLSLAPHQAILVEIGTYVPGALISF